jgi:hypothetical protein
MFQVDRLEHAPQARRCSRCNVRSPKTRVGRGAVKVTHAGLRILRPAWVMQNFSDEHVPVIEGTITVPTRGGAEAVVDAADIAAVAVERWSTLTPMLARSTRRPALNRSRSATSPTLHNRSVGPMGNNVGACAAGKLGDRASVVAMEVGQDDLGQVLRRVAYRVHRGENGIRRARHAGVDHGKKTIRFPDVDVARLQGDQIHILGDPLRLHVAIHLRGGF